MTFLRCWQSVSLLVLSFCLSSSAPVSAADEPTWEWFLNRAVQKELKLTEAQQKQVDELITELKESTEWMIAKGDGRDRERYEKRFAEELEKQGRKFIQLLTPEQEERFWQIDMQSLGRERALATVRAQKRLQLTEKQIEDVNKVLDETKTAIRKLSGDNTLDEDTLEKRFEQAKRDCLARELAVLTEEQRKSFDMLFGKPFDLELLKYPSGVKPRALTVVYPSRGNSAWFLLGTEESQKQIGLSSDQISQIQEISAKADRELTAVRLGILKATDIDFRDLSEDEQRKMVKKIFAEAEPIRQRATEEVLKLLKPEQIAEFDQVAIDTFGPRALESNSVATRFKLTAEQKVAFAKLVADFDAATAPLAVLRKQERLSNKYEAATQKLDAAINAILTPEQQKLLEQKEK